MDSNGTVPVPQVLLIVLSIRVGMVQFEMSHGTWVFPGNYTDSLDDVHIKISNLIGKRTGEVGHIKGQGETARYVWVPQNVSRLRWCLNGE